MLAPLYLSSITVYFLKDTPFVLSCFSELRFIRGCYGSEASSAATPSALATNSKVTGSAGVKQFKDAPLHIGTPTEGPPS